MDQFSQCPRCGTKAFEQLKTYSHCVECLYFEDRHYDSESAYFQARSAEALLAKLEENENIEEEQEPEDELALQQQ